MPKFIAHVSLHDSGGKHHVFAPGDNLPAWAKSLVGEHVLDGKPTLTAAQKRAAEKKAKADAEAAAKAEEKAKAEAEANTGKSTGPHLHLETTEGAGDADGKTGADETAEGGDPDFTSEQDS